MQRTNLSHVRDLLNALQATNLEDFLRYTKNFKQNGTTAAQWSKFLPEIIIDSLNGILLIGHEKITSKTVNEALAEKNIIDIASILNNLVRLISILTLLYEQNLRLNNLSKERTLAYISKLEEQRKNIEIIFNQKLEVEKSKAKQNTDDLRTTIQSLREQLLKDIDLAIEKESAKIQSELGWFSSTPTEAQESRLRILQKKVDEINLRYSDDAIEKQLLLDQKDFIKLALSSCENAKTFTTTNYASFMQKLKSLQENLYIQNKLENAYVPPEENKTLVSVIKTSLFREKDKGVPQMDEQEQKRHNDELARIINLLNNYLLYLHNKLTTPKIKSLQDAQLETLDKKIQKNYETDKTSKDAKKWRKYIIVRELQGILENKAEIPRDKVKKCVDKVREYKEELGVKRGLKTPKGQKLVSDILAPYQAPQKTSSNDSSFPSRKRSM